MNESELNKLYSTNNDFKAYVDHYCKKYNESRSISVTEALTHLIVKNVAKYYIERGTYNE